MQSAYMQSQSGMEPISHKTILSRGRYTGLALDGIDPDTLHALHHQMVRLRRCEEALMLEYRVAAEMRCPVHFTLGQEAVPAALSLLIKRDDYLFSHHRCHGYFLAKGAPMSALVAELFGRSTGANGGLAGSQEISMPSHNFHSGAILTGASSIATGTAMAFQFRKEPRIAVAGFGEAATEEGIFWEAVSFAAVRKLPLVYVCENNRYSMYSPQLRRQPADDISARVAAFGFRTFTLFGNDVTAAHRALAEAVAHARAGKGPCFLEFYTYRWNAHVGPESDDIFGYRPAAELEFWKSNCPIALFEEKLAAAGLLQPERQQAMIGKIDEEIAGAFRFARSSPFPQNVDLAPLNLSATSPLAESLLPTSMHGEFDENQASAVMAPY
jgi:TPP-dependent pyruvate/acetoin dehydrogenase alpha subunit